MKQQRARHGKIRQLPSGNWQARYKAPDGTERVAPTTFLVRKDAQDFLDRTHVDMSRRKWRDPLEGKLLFEDFAENYVEYKSSRCAPRTVEGYRSSLRIHLLPAFGGLTLGELTPDKVDRWWAQADRAGVGRVARKNAYILLHGMMKRAVMLDLIEKTPCRVEGAWKDVSRPRPYMTPEEFFRIRGEMTPSLRPVLDVMLGGHPRLGEVIALRRSDLDLDAGTLRIERQFIKAKGGQRLSKTKNGSSRTPHLPAETLESLRDYLQTNPRLPEAWLFSDTEGNPLTHNFVERKWDEARRAAGLVDRRLHDIRHTGITQFAALLDTKSLMARGGHLTPQASQRYQHAVSTRDMEAASKVSFRSSSEQVG